MVKRKKNNSKKVFRYILSPAFPGVIALALIIANFILACLKQTSLTERISIYAFLFLILSITWLPLEYVLGSLINKTKKRLGFAKQNKIVKKKHTKRKRQNKKVRKPRK